MALDTRFDTNPEAEEIRRQEREAIEQHIEAWRYQCLQSDCGQWLVNAKLDSGREVVCEAKDAGNFRLENGNLYVRYGTRGVKHPCPQRKDMVRTDDGGFGKVTPARDKLQNLPEWTSLNGDVPEFDAWRP